MAAAFSQLSDLYRALIRYLNEELPQWGEVWVKVRDVVYRKRRIKWDAHAWKRHTLHPKHTRDYKNAFWLDETGQNMQFFEEVLCIKLRTTQKQRNK